MRAINQACSSFATDPKRRLCRCRRRRRAKYDSVCLSEAKQKLIQDLWFSRITHSLLTLHICFVFDEATHQGRTGTAAFFFFFFCCFPFRSLFSFLTLRHITTFYRLLVWRNGSEEKKKEKKKPEYPAGLKASHHVATKTQRSIPSPPTRELFFFFFFEIPIFPPSPLQRLPTTARHRK